MVPEHAEHAVVWSSSGSSSTTRSQADLSIVPEDVKELTVLDVLLIGPAALRVLCQLSTSSLPQLVYRPDSEQGGAVLKFRAVPSDSKGMPSYRSKTDAENAIAVFVLDLGEEGEPPFPSLAEQLAVLRILAFLFRRPPRGQHRARLARILLLGDGEPPLEADEFASSFDGAKQCFAGSLADVDRALLGIAADRMGRRASLSSTWSGCDELTAGLARTGSAPRRAPRDPQELWQLGKWDCKCVRRLVPWCRRWKSRSREDVDARTTGGAAARTKDAAQEGLDPKTPGGAAAGAAEDAEEELEMELI